MKLDFSKYPSSFKRIMLIIDLLDSDFNEVTLKLPIKTALTFNPKITEEIDIGSKVGRFVIANVFHNLKHQYTELRVVYLELEELLEEAEQYRNENQVFDDDFGDDFDEDLDEELDEELITDDNEEYESVMFEYDLNISNMKVGLFMDLQEEGWTIENNQDNDSEGQ